MNYYKENGNIVIDKNESFSISETLECGQCFNFEKLDEEDYVLTAFGRCLRLYEKNGKIVFEDTTEEDFKNIWIKYFDFDKDYSEIKDFLSKRDKTMKEALDYAPGIRILNQEFFECLISFIISQNNRIPMIKKVVANLSRRYGKYIKTVNGKDYYSFPKTEDLAGISEEELMESKTGFRAKYIIDAVTRVLNGEINENDFTQLSTEEVRKQLMEIKGVGPKVADCVMLFSLGRSDAFPTDVWVKRVMSHFYFNGEDTPIKKIHAFAYELFGSYAGFAQQYLFNYARQFKIGA